MFADDAVIYSRDRDSLQNALALVETWSLEHKLVINHIKTKAMKFRRGGRLSRADVLKLNGYCVDFVSKFTYLGITYTTTGRAFSDHVNDRARKAITCLNTEIRNPRCLSVKTALTLFDMKIGPIASYGISVIWEHLSVANLCVLDRVKTMFLKKVLSVSKLAKNRLVYALIGCPTFIESLKLSFRLPETQNYDTFLQNHVEKFTSIDPEFFSTPGMIIQNWREPHQVNRHVLTRFSIHGFHYLLCSNHVFHEAVPDVCMCKYCLGSCGTFHLLSCTSCPFSLTSAANF